MPEPNTYPGPRGFLLDEPSYTCENNPYGPQGDPYLPWYYYFVSVLILAFYLLWGLFILQFYSWKKMFTGTDDYAEKHDKWMEWAEQRKQIKNDVKLRNYLLDELEQVESRLEHVDEAQIKQIQTELEPKPANDG